MYLLIILLLLLLPGTATPEAGRGQLTIVVRDRDGQRLPNVQIALIHDADDGRVLIDEARTDAQGELHYDDLAWGLYIVQFRGKVGDRSVLPAERQNLGLLDDGSEAAGGFGVRFAEAARTELFVLTTVPGKAHAVPMFDLAPSVQAIPVPFDPILDTSSPAPEPLPSHAPTVQPRGRNGTIGVLLLFLGGLGVTILVGLWRSHQTRKEAR